MKIGIYTLPLHSNYGGILQAYALQYHLCKQGHKALLLKHHSVEPQRINLKTRYLVYLKRTIRKHILKEKIFIFEDKYIVRKYNKKLSLIKPFRNKYLKCVKFKNNRGIKLDTIIVGSDQVWRPAYTMPYVENYFLDFLESDNSTKKIIYAASFGTTEWEFTKEQTETCARLIKLFDLITVREDSGIELCKKYFHVDATLVLDPTMLLDKDDYVTLIEQENTPKSPGNMFAYILDEDKRKLSLINSVTEEMGLTKFYIMPSKEALDSDTPYPSVTAWLRGFMDAEYIITDSFHGCVFSIIFNKPFIAIGNKNRGQARFESLLKLFNLEDRLVDINDISANKIQESIDWDKVNSILKTMKVHSSSLLKNSITNK